VGLISHSPIFFNISKGIKFMLAPKSSKALSIDKAPIESGMLKMGPWILEASLFE